MDGVIDEKVRGGIGMRGRSEYMQGIGVGGDEKGVIEKGMGKEI